MTRTSWPRLALLALVLGPVSMACSDESPSLAPPIGPSPPTAQSSGNGPVSGSVSDTAYRPLAGARVEVLDGPEAGTSTIAGSSGEFSFPGTFDHATRFRASMPGHVESTRTVNSRAPVQFRGIHFELLVSGEVLNVAGEYTLTVSADPACVALPDEARTRTYALAALPNSGSHPATYFDVYLSGPTVLDAWDRNERSSIALAGDYAVLVFGYSAGPALVERISPSVFYAFSARASVTVGDSPSSIATPFDGVVEYCVMNSDTAVPSQGYDYSCPAENATTHVRCESTRHRLTLVRR